VKLISVLLVSDRTVLLLDRLDLEDLLLLEVSLINVELVSLTKVLLVSDTKVLLEELD
jgi:hypothetical protein